MTPPATRSPAVAALRRLGIALRSHHLAAELVTGGEAGPHLMIGGLLAACADADGRTYRWPIGPPDGPRRRRPGHALFSHWPAQDVNGAARRIAASAPASARASSHPAFSSGGDA